MPEPKSQFPRRIEVIRNLVREARHAETYEQRDPLIDTILKRLDTLDESIALMYESRGRLGGQKTAERGPEYFKQIAAMRKTRAGGRPRKNPEKPTT